MPTKNNSILDRLTQAILSEKAAAGGTFEKLAEAIKRKNADESDLSIDRRKLARITGTGNKPISVEDRMRIKLSLNELLALDGYLQEQGGLAAVLASRSVLSLLAESSRVTFYLGAKPIEDTDFISRWDVQSVEELMRSLNQESGGIDFNVHDVFLRTSREQSLAPGQCRELFGSEPWYQSLCSSYGGSIICVGSPRAVNASEIVLAQMFGTEAFATNNQIDDELPFNFVWSDEEYKNIPSSVAVDERTAAERTSGASSDMARSPKVQPTGNRKVSALFVAGDYLSVPQFADAGMIKEWTTYSIIAIDRSLAGRLRIVLAGLSGTGTLASARLLKQLPADAVPTDGTVVWAPVRALVRRNPDYPSRDGRQVVHQELMQPPKQWMRQAH